MTVHELIEARSSDARVGQVIKLAIMAVGGQGGGVLTSWIEMLARTEGYSVQATSVAGVAQRTGATIYYIEMAPVSERTPVFALAPAAGDVDVLIAAELMEAGRAILRGFVTPDRTTLIASTHRALAVSEKTVPGDGIASAEEVLAATQVAAERLILGDMERIARDNGSVISAAILGALAASEALPFRREAFETAIRQSGRGVEASLKAFDAAFEEVRTGKTPRRASETSTRDAVPTGPEQLCDAWAGLAARADSLPVPVAELAASGLRKVVDFQDIAYGAEYLDRIDTIMADDTSARDWQLSREAAKYIANAMAYDDVIGVADKKTRASRFDRIHREMGADERHTMRLTEFLHPRAEEIVSLFPTRFGRRIAESSAWMARLDRWFNRGRRIRTDGIRGFLVLYALAGLRRWRRKTLRHSEEQAHLDRWLETVLSTASRDYSLAVELIRCRRLIKGYSDTHTRGLSKFDRVLEGAQLVDGRDDAADWTRRLREAALADEDGDALDGALKTIRSFV